MDLQATAGAIQSVIGNVERVITGKRDVVAMATIALFADTHLLIEDVPGVGKTMLARALAKSIDGSFRRVQGTPDLLPSDITGSSVLEQSTGSFRFVEGPVFTNVLLVDEINRATPKTQSALLEVMEERSVSADGATYEIAPPFFVVATLNPIEHHGTFPLPEGELDRFGLSIRIGYPDHRSERDVVLGQMDHHPIDDLEPVVHPDELITHRRSIRDVHVDEGILDYMLTIVRSTRETPAIALGASPRGSLALVRCCQAHALSKGRDYVLPDDVKTLAAATLAHRIVLTTDGRSGQSSARALVDELARAVPVPVELPAGGRR